VTGKKSKLIHFPLRWAIQSNFEVSDKSCIKHS
jgi:hypothetical protein